nr:hypothetical protein Iba_chr03aCG11680 [Ipomoea batatas]
MEESFEEGIEGEKILDNEVALLYWVIVDYRFSINWGFNTATFTPINETNHQGRALQLFLLGVHRFPFLLEFLTGLVDAAGFAGSSSQKSPENQNCYAAAFGVQRSPELLPLAVANWRT